MIILKKKYIIASSLLIPAAKWGLFNSPGSVGSINVPAAFALVSFSCGSLLGGESLRKGLRGAPIRRRILRCCHGPDSFRLAVMKWAYFFPPCLPKSKPDKAHPDVNSIPKAYLHTKKTSSQFDAQPSPSCHRSFGLLLFSSINMSAHYRSLSRSNCVLPGLNSSTLSYPRRFAR